MSPNDSILISSTSILASHKPSSMILGNAGSITNLGFGSSAGKGNNPGASVDAGV